MQSASKKYPRTPHLPWSLGTTSDDRILGSVDHFQGHEVIVTVKMDGENTTMYRDHIHARSMDSLHHPSRAWVKDLWSRVRHDIPEGWRVCGENLYATHSIHYENLASYFLVFSVWDHDHCLSWQDTVEWVELLGLTLVPVLWQGIWDEEIIRSLYSPQYHGDTMEGYVVRMAHEFQYAEFGRNIGKFVRAGHVQTDQHWSQRQVIPNKLRE